MKAIGYIFIGLFFLISQTSKAQLNEEKIDFQSWTDLTLSYKFNQQFSIGGDLGIRGMFSSKDWTLFYIRPKVRYVFSQFFSTDGGLGYFYTSNTDFDNSSELRFYQDFNFIWPDLGFVIFQHRFRFEQRLFYYENLENDFGARSRYQIKLQSRDFHLFNAERPFYLNAMVEGFIPFNESAQERFVNNARINAGLGKRFSEKLRSEIYYIWQRSRQLEDDGFETSEHVLRIKFLYNLNLIEGNTDN